jgi:hypothetical protein
MLRLVPLPSTTTRLAVGLVLCWFCVGCTSSDETPSSEGTGPTTNSTATAPTITLTRENAPLTVTIAQSGDGVRRSQRAGLRTAIGAPVASWFDGAFLGVDYPTAGFPHAFDSWTAAAAGQAADDAASTTNVTLGPDLIAVVADRQAATLYVFAHAGVAGGATAKVRLVLTGEKQDGSLVRCTVSGNVYLTRDGRRWRIFGYDLQRSQEAS